MDHQNLKLKIRVQEGGDIAAVEQAAAKLKNFYRGIRAETETEAESASAATSETGSEAAAATDSASDSVSDSVSEFILVREATSWRLEDPQGLKLRIDFDQTGPDYRRKAAKGKQELIARAVGSQRGAKRILDFSAGLGQDAVFLAQLGFEVTAVERNPLLAFLLQEAAAASQREDLKRLRIVHADALDLLRDEKFLAGFDAGYFDPMYPLKKKSALPRQEMRIFRALVGDDGDSSELVEAFRASSLPRLAVKRPTEAPPLSPNPVHSFEGKTVRYDVYVRSP